MNYKDLNDYEVLYLVKEHEEEAEQILYEKYRPLIQSLAYKYYKRAKNRGYELADFMQEGYIGLKRAIEKYEVSKDCLFYTFALLCIERQMQTVVRGLSTLKQEVLNHTLSYDYILPESDLAICDIVAGETQDNPEYLLLEKETMQRLIRFRNELPDVQAQVFELRFNGFRYSEISTLLDLSTKSVDSYLVRIRRKLKNLGWQVPTLS